MESLSKIRRFVENDSCNRECEDFSYTLFENIDFSKKEKSYSFFRSDFRGARFVNVIFNKNNFDRADFISCSFDNCKFLDVDILACEIKNCSFNNVSFTENHYDNTSIQECSFINCVFSREKMLVNMKKCVFEKSKFDKCTFERSTTEELTFKNSQLNCVDFATMHAECHKFISCNLSDVKLGISYVYGYLYHDTDISKFEVLYRGKKVNLNSEQEALKLIEGNRIYEFFNILFIYEKYKLIPNFLHNALETIFNNYNHIYKLEMINMLKALQFHTLYNSLPYECIIDCIEILQDCKLSNFPLEDELEFISIRESIVHLIENHKYNEKLIQTATQSYAVVTLHIDTDDITIATNISQNFFDEICIKYGLHNDSTLVESKKGSVILTFVITAAIALLIPKIIKECNDTIIDIRVKSQLAKQIVKKLDKKQLSNSELNFLIEIATNKNLISNDKMSIPELIKSIKIFV
jgi:uncharacterized protein YjbI with pentapeptide repeats